MNNQLFADCTKYTDITKELLDSIQVGDLVAIQGWDSLLEVKCVSDNYFVMADTSPDKQGILRLKTIYIDGFSNQNCSCRTSCCTHVHTGIRYSVRLVFLPCTNTIRYQLL